MPRTMLRLWTVGALALALVLLVVPPVLAAEETRVLDHGFWWQGNSGVGPAAAPPDVERGQLLVEATPTGATAIAAIRGQLEDGHGSPTITLEVLSDAGGAEATLLACHTGSGWTGMHAGRFDAKPSVDCDSGSVQAIRAEDGSSWDLPIGPLQFDDQFNIVLVPGADPDSGVVTPFRLVFDTPRADGITTVVDAPAPPPATPTTIDLSTAGSSSGGATSTPAFRAPTAAPAPASSTGSAFSSAPAPIAQPTVNRPPVAPALPPADLGQTATAPILSAQSQPVFPELDETDVGRLRLFGLVLLVIGTTTGVLWWRDERAVPLRAVLTGVDAATLADLQERHDEPIDGGLGRFRRQRAGEAPKLF